MQTHYRACNLCEAICGLEIKVENGEIITITGDKKDPLSRGHICPKAVALKDIYLDPNRIKYPIKRVGNEWQQISWEQAFEDVVANIKRIQAKHGSNALGIYQGNPSVHNLGTMMNTPAFVKSLNTHNVFSATSTDQLPHHFVSWQLYGHPMLLPIPDIDNSDFMLIIGANPIVSNGSMMTVPDVEHRLKAIQKRGGKVVVIDPRKTETARMADQHLFIKPNNDVFLLLAMVHVLFDENLVNIGLLAPVVDNISIIKKIVTPYSPEKTTHHTGIAAQTVRELCRAFSQANSAVCYGRIGVSTQSFGTLSLWLINVINILTGNLDKTGGAMFTKPAVDFLTKAKPENRFARWRSRVRGLPEFLGELPAAVMAEEILNEGPDQIKAMITSCGNPVLSTPNGGSLDKAFAQLEYMVSIDIYINETTRHANIILPSATGLEVPHYDLTFNILAVRNTAKYSLPTMPKCDGAKYDWQIYQELQQRLAGKTTIDLQNPDEKLAMGLINGPYQINLEKLKEQPEGLDLGPLNPRLPEALLTADKRINIAPEILQNDLKRLDNAFQNTENNNEFNLLLIGRRHLRDNNSWMHNSQRLIKGNNRCTLMLNQKDAADLKLCNHQEVQLRSRVGKINIPIEISDTIMPGVVSMPHGYGHNKSGVQLDIAIQHAGVSINDLTDDMYLDDLTGNAAFNGVAVRIEKI